MMRKTQEHNRSTTTQLWVSHHATDTGEIEGGSTELNLSLSLQFLAFGQPDPSRQPKLWQATACSSPGKGLQPPFLMETVSVQGLV